MVPWPEKRDRLRWWLAGWCALAVLLLVPVPARADLLVTTLEHDSWPTAVAALQMDPRSEGRWLRVVVTDEAGHRVPCDEYTLAFDEAGQAAFVLGGCDPATEATDVQLRDRSALFEHDDLVARPRLVAISAVQMRMGRSQGGAHPQAGSDLSCSVVVRPFLRDLAQGTVVHLAPGRFVLRPVGQGVVATVEGDGWLLRGWRAGLTIEYEVIDTQRGEVLLHDRATLACGVAPLPPAPGAGTAPDPRAACASAQPLTAGIVQGTYDPAVVFGHQASSCGHAHGAGRVDALRLARRSVVRLRLANDRDGVLFVRHGCGEGSVGGFMSAVVPRWFQHSGSVAQAT